MESFLSVGIVPPSNRADLLPYRRKSCRGLKRCPLAGVRVGQSFGWWSDMNGEFFFAVAVHKKLQRIIPGSGQGKGHVEGSDNTDLAPRRHVGFLGARGEISADLGYPGAVSAVEDE